MTEKINATVSSTVKLLAKMAAEHSAILFQLNELNLKLMQESDNTLSPELQEMLKKAGRELEKTYKAKNHQLSYRLLTEKLARLAYVINQLRDKT